MYKKWLEEMVSWDGVEEIPRYKAIGRFVADGLQPFLKANGYTIRPSTKQLGQGVARILYSNSGVSCMDSRLPWVSSDEVATMEHKWHFNHVMSESAWEYFWSIWAVWPDVTDEWAQDRRIDIQEYCWSQIDLDESSQTQVVEEHMGIAEDGGFVGRGEDGDAMD